MFRVLTYLMMLLLLSSCTKTSGHNPEEEHLEHVIPAHQPHSYNETVEQLKLRFNSMVAGTNPSAEATQELEDIITWLPDLAGDSELKKQDWEGVLEVQKELLAKFKLLKQDTKNTQIKNEIDGLLTKLELLREASTNMDSTTTKDENSDNHSEK